MFSDNMIGQKQKFRVMIGTVVKSLNRLDEVVAMVRALGKRHVGYGTQQGHYDVVAQALVGALAEMHGKTWSTDLQDAWVAAYTIVATTMKDAAAEVEPPLPTATAEATPKVVADAPAKAAVYQPPARGNFFARLKAFFRGQGSRT